MAAPKRWTGPGLLGGNLHELLGPVGLFYQPFLSFPKSEGVLTGSPVHPTCTKGPPGGERRVRGAATGLKTRRLGQHGSPRLPADWLSVSAQPVSQLWGVGWGGAGRRGLLVSLPEPKAVLCAQ